MASLTAPAGTTQTRAALFLMLAMAATVGTALGFQYLGGYIPCKLCLEERIPYYVGVPVMALAVISATLRWPPVVTRGLLAIGGALMVWSLYMGVYHAGVEWNFWAGPTDCGAVAAPAGNGKGILDSLNTFVPPSCDEAAGRFLGISFAGWNAVASLILAGIAWWSTFAGKRD
jgi:disulfide bond formation protein DsbB